MSTEEAYAAVLEDKIENLALAFVADYGVDHVKAKETARAYVMGELAKKAIEDWKQVARNC